MRLCPPCPGLCAHSWALLQSLCLPVVHKGLDVLTSLLANSRTAPFPPQQLLNVNCFSVGRTQTFLMETVEGIGVFLLLLLLFLFFFLLVPFLALSYLPRLCTFGWVFFFLSNGGATLEGCPRFGLCSRVVPHPPLSLVRWGATARGGSGGARTKESSAVGSAARGRLVYVPRVGTINTR